MLELDVVALGPQQAALLDAYHLPKTIYRVRQGGLNCPILTHQVIHLPLPTRPRDSHMLSCLTKLAMLLCLKYWGSTSLAKRLWSLTRKLVPLCRECRPSTHHEGRSRMTP